MSLIRTENASHAHAKAGCYLCGNPTDVIDTGIDIVGEGGLCICVACVNDMARIVGLDPEHDIAECAEVMDALRSDLEDALAEKDEAEAAFEVVAARLVRDRKDEAGKPVAVPTDVLAEAVAE